MEQQLTPEKQCHVAFLSSLSGMNRKMREDLYAANKPLLWVAEGNRPDLAEKRPMEIVDTCIEALSNSELFICCLLGNDRGQSAGGTLIEVGDVEAQVSYFEIEVFAAAARGLPIVFLETETFSADQRLAEWLEILQRSAVPVLWEEKSKVKDLPARIKNLITRRQELVTNWKTEAEGATKRLLMALVSARGNVEAVRHGGSDLLWSNRNRFERSYSDDQVLQRATALLETVKNQSDPNRKMSRLYFVFRELFARPYTETKSPELLACWNDALGEWWGASSWYGLHNHISMGVISTLGTQAVVRESLKRTAASDVIAPDNLLPPHGPLASAYYSLGKLLVGVQRRTVLKTSLVLTERVIIIRSAVTAIQAFTLCVDVFNFC